MSSVRNIAVGLLLATVAPDAGAQDLAAVDSVFKFSTPDAPGCAVGVSQRGVPVVNRSYGLADLERRVPISPRSRFDIGSTQKQFTAALTLMLVEEKRLRLSDDIRTYLPEMADVGHTITVNHLLTHTSGIRDWTALLPFAPEGTEVLPLILRQRGVNFAPGEEWSYSNSGYELLKEIVARVSGMPFAEFARQRLFEPLGMASTAYVPDILHAGDDAARGYQRDGGGWKLFMRLGANRGGGAIASTIDDLLRWNDALASGKLGKFVTAALQEQARLNNGRQLRYARGLIVEPAPGGTVISHSGGAAGFSTWMGRLPEHGLAVVVACNFDPVSATDLAGRVAKIFVPGIDSGPGAPGPVAAAGVDVAGRAGLYFNEAGDPLRLTAASNRLLITGGGQLVPVATDRFRPLRPNLFFMSQDDFELRFPGDDVIELRSMEGKVTTYRRAIPYTPSADDLKALEGRYRSDELGAVFRVEAISGGLLIRSGQPNGQGTPVAPVARDVFQIGQIVLRFRRDANGAVTGFDFRNPVIRGIRFTRVPAE